MKDKILELINEGLCTEEIVEKLYNNECISHELKEKYHNCCNEDADCYECWQIRIEKEY